MEDQFLLVVASVFHGYSHLKCIKINNNHNNLTHVKIDSCHAFDNHVIKGKYITPLAKATHKYIYFKWLKI